jgi:hypothetical protein
MIGFILFGKECPTIDICTFAERDLFIDLFCRQTQLNENAQRKQPPSWRKFAQSGHSVGESSI